MLNYIIPNKRRNAPSLILRMSEKVDRIFLTSFKQDKVLKWYRMNV